DALRQEWLRASALNDFTQRFLISYQGAYLERLRTEATRRAVGLVLALHAYRDAKGRWPAALTDLPDGLRTRLALDPFSGRRFVYRAGGGEFKLYSVAEDGTDDGGRH